MATYNWQQNDWPHFGFDLSEVEDELFAFAEKAGNTGGIMNGLPQQLKIETLVELMATEALKTSEIEGEYLNREEVYSSIQKNLGLTPQVRIRDKRAAGIAALMMDVRRSFAEPLTEEKLFDWHRMLMADASDVEVGKWRTHSEPMQIVSGALGKRKIHFEAPPSAQVPKEMKRFLKWFNDTSPGGKNEIKKGPVRSALAHLYFESIHPFEDGNGRIGRAIAEKALAQNLGRPVLLSLSKTIEENKKNYYQQLEQAQRSNVVTAWVAYFVETILIAQTKAEATVIFTLKKADFFHRYDTQLNQRHQTIVRRMMEEGPEGFLGGMNARKYVGLTKVSKATATRDLQYLAEIGALKAEGAGRSTSYQLNL